MHDAAYLDAVRAAPYDPFFTGWGLGTGDNPIVDRMHEVERAGRRGDACAAAEAVWHGEATRAVNIAGGLHHAMRARASGFCVYNDPAVAIAHLLRLGAERVAYVDVDVHHGDGVQAAFWDDPRVLTVSLHESPLTLFPGTGFPDETGGPGAEGTAVNVALPPGTDDAGWLRAFHAVVPEVLRRVPAAGAVHPVRGRHLPARPAGQPAGERRRAARHLPGPAGAGRRALRRALGGHRRRWLRAVRGCAAGVDPPAGHRDRRSRWPRRR